MLASSADAMVCISNSSLPVSIGVGETPTEAWAEMVHECVMRHVDEYEALHGRCPEDRYILFIDACINRKCSILREGDK